MTAIAGLYTVYSIWELHSFNSTHSQRISAKSQKHQGPPYKKYLSTPCCLYIKMGNGVREWAGGNRRHLVTLRSWPFQRVQSFYHSPSWMNFKRPRLNMMNFINCHISFILTARQKKKIRARSFESIMKIFINHKKDTSGTIIRRLRMTQGQVVNLLKTFHRRASKMRLKNK